MAMTRVRELRDAFGEMLNRYKWSVFLTLSSKRTLSLEAAKRMAIRKIRSLTRDVSYFVVAEGTMWETHHVHVLMGNIDETHLLEIYKKWKKEYGRIWPLSYDPARGAQYYMTKYITSDRMDWDIDICEADKCKIGDPGPFNRLLKKH